jgi:23S rRNA (guanine745-N1)-methyltransferase
VLSVFGPRNPAEITRLLAPGGAVIVASPGQDHQRELREALGLIGIDARKESRLAEAFAGYRDATVTAVRYQARLSHPDLTRLVAMGPSARHVTPDELAARVGALPEPAAVTVDVEVRSYRRA